MYLQALELDKHLLGEEHPYVATDLHNLADLYRSQGSYNEAQLLYLQSLELKKHLLGEEHPEVALSLTGLADVYFAQGHNREAQPNYMQALVICEHRLGKDHPWTVKVLERFTKFLRQEITKRRADLESLPDNPTIQAILAQVQASLEQSE
jgi:tetratricopeptide (TPR) repeat protein